MIRFTCDCGRQLQARDNQAGQTAACPLCGKVAVIPEVGEVGRPTAGRGWQPPPAVELPSDDGPAGTAGPRQPEAPVAAKARLSFALGLLGMFGLSVLTGIPAIVVGALALRDLKRDPAHRGGKGLAVGGIVMGSAGSLLLLILIPLVPWIRHLYARSEATNNLKHLGRAMQEYNAMNGRFPAVGRINAGQPLSWRVHLLPFLPYYGPLLKYDPQMAWDSPVNASLLANRPDDFALPGDKARDKSGMTVYQVFVGPDTAFQGPNGLGVADIPDGLSNTIFVVEGASGVPWTKPQDLPYNPNRPLPALGGHFGDGFLALMGDGSVRWIPAHTPERVVRDLITRNDQQGLKGW